MVGESAKNGRVYFHNFGRFGLLPLLASDPSNSKLHLFEFVFLVLARESDAQGLEMWGC